MTKILVSGLINIETTLQVDVFPIEYSPVNFPFFGVRSTVSGVGYNVSKALTMLGHEVAFLSLIGQDAAAALVVNALAADGIAAQYVLPELNETPQSVILYEKSGRRQIWVDLKDIQERTYPAGLFEQAAKGCDWLVLCNINFSRPLLERARRTGKRIATDVHTIASLNDPYEQDFLRAAEVLFMSDERLPCPPEEWVRSIWECFGTPIVVVGLGARGALLGLRDGGLLEQVPAVQPRPVVNTIGGGDALFSAFLHTFSTSGDALLALRKAVLFAGWKIGERSAAEGFLGAQELDNLYNRYA